MAGLRREGVIRMPIGHNNQISIADDPNALAAGELTPSKWNNDPHVIKDAEGNVWTVDQLNTPLGYVNVKAYGATGNGTTNDTTAINAALAANPNVYFPPGTYMCNLVIALGNFNLKGAGKNITSLFPPAGSTASTVKINGAGAFIDGWSIKDMSIDGVSTNAAIELLGANPNPVTHGQIENIQILYAEYGIWLHGTNMDIYKNMFQNIRIESCTNGIYTDGNHVYDSFKNIEIISTGAGYATYDLGASNTYESVSCDGCCYDGGNYNRYLSHTIEGINTATPPTNKAFTNNGIFTMIDLCLIEVNPAKCSVGFYTNSLGNCIISLIARGATYVPTYLGTFDTSSSGYILYAYGSLNTAIQGAGTSFPAGNINNWYIAPCPWSVGLYPAVLYGTAAPTTGAHNKGDQLWNTAPSASGTLLWVCTTAGSPGTWTAVVMP